MDFLKGITKIVFSPLSGVAEIVDDWKGKNKEGSQYLSITTLGLSSMIKGTLKGVEKGVKDIFDDNEE